MSFRRSGNLLRPAGAKKGTKGPGALFPHPLSTGSASGRSAAAPLHPWLQSAAPLGRKGEKRAGDPFPSSAFHGFRVGPQRGPAAPPVATIRRPVGAKDDDALLTENAVVQRPALPSSIFIAAAFAMPLALTIANPPPCHASYQRQRAVSGSRPEIAR